MKIYAAAFTERGKQLGNRIFGDWEPEQVIFREGEPLAEWTEQGFAHKALLVFIGAMGIAVRAIAPYVKDKLSDSPVVVLDEAGNYVIPVLSGHVGGANEYAVRIAEKIQALPVITTATDVNHLFAVDVFARKNALTIVNREGIGKISSRVLAGEKVDIVVSADPQDYENATLALKPKEYILGIGCKKGKSYEEIDSCICALLEKKALRGITIQDFYCMASIDRKKEEPGLVEWAERNRIPFVTFSPEQLQQQEGEFTSSAFVESQVGVDNVCERAAIAAAGEGARLIQGKYADNGITLAIVKRKWSVNFDET